MQRYWTLYMFVGELALFIFILKSKAFFTCAADSVTLESILTATGIWPICIRAQGIGPTVIVGQAGTFIYILKRKKKPFLAHNSFFAAKICRLSGSCWKKGIESTRDNLTSTHSAVSLVTSYTAADVETLRVGAQGVGVALVKCVTVAFINVWIYVLQRCKWRWQWPWTMKRWLNLCRG